MGTVHEYLLSKDLNRVPAILVYCLVQGGVVLLPFIDYILISGSDTDSIDTVITIKKKRFNVVDLEEASYLP